MSFFTLAMTSFVTSPVPRPDTLASTDTTRSRSRWSMIAGPTPCLIVATWPSGSVLGAPFGPVTTSGSWLRSSALRRDSGASRTSTLRISPLGSCQSPASMPANAGRSDCATWPTVTPSAPATPRFRSTLSSGFWPFVLSPMSTAPGVDFTIAVTWSAT